MAISFPCQRRERLQIAVRFMEKGSVNDSSQLPVEVSVRRSHLFDHEIDSARHPVDYTRTFTVENIPASMLPASGILEVEQQKFLDMMWHAKIGCENTDKRPERNTLFQLFHFSVCCSQDCSPLTSNQTVEETGKPQLQRSHALGAWC